MGNIFSDIQEAGKQIAGCFCCLLCIGPIFIAVGAAFIASSLTDTRGQKLDIFANSMAYWNNNGAAFAGNSFSLDLQPVTAAGATNGTAIALGTLAQWSLAKSNAKNDVRDKLVDAKATWCV